ncbi:laminin subunit alpha [Trichonephila clavipes]|nr:laminin subunit alpha [Trichonephila clavipes]
MYTQGSVDQHLGFLVRLEHDLSAPLEVLVEQTTSSSVHLSWKPPPSPKGRNLKLFTYSLTLTPLTHYGHAGLEKEFSLPPSITSKLVGGLTEGTRYVVQLSAIYGDTAQKLSHDALVRVAAPKFTVFIPPEAQQDIPVGDDGLPPDEPRKELSITIKHNVKMYILCVVYTITSLG